MRVSAALVVASERWRRGERPSVSTVTVSSSPSRTLAAAQGFSRSRRRARCRSNRVIAFVPRWTLWSHSRVSRGDPGPRACASLQRRGNRAGSLAKAVPPGAARFPHRFVPPCSDTATARPRSLARTRSSSMQSVSGRPNTVRPSRSYQRRVESSVFRLSPLSVTSSLHLHHPDRATSMRRSTKTHR